MASFLRDTRFQLLATAAVSGATAASLVLGYQALRDQKPAKLASTSSESSLSSSTEGLEKAREFSDPEDARNQALARRAQAGDFDEELILEQLARNQVFLTPEGLQRLRDAFVVVVGCGGVGSHCAAALARSGVSRLRLIDFDQVTLSSLNRHAVATLADVGIAKVKCLQRRLVGIAPWVRFDLRQAKFEEGVAQEMLAPWSLDGDSHAHPPDYIIDAIDNIDTKVMLLKYCFDNGLPVVSAMGAGCKADPTRIMVGDISASTDDGLSRATRRRLKLLGITHGIPCVYSTEKPGEGKASLLPLPEDEFQRGAVGDLGVMPSFRVRILPVLGTMPAIFGLTAANHAILRVTGYPVEYVAAKGRERLYESILTYVQSSEEKLARLFCPGTTGLKVALTTGDCAFVAEEVYRSRSAVSGIPTKLVLIRWRRPEGASSMEVIDEQKCSTVRLGDLVCMTKEEAGRHEREIFVGGRRVEEIYDGETIRKVEARMAEAARYEEYR